MSQIHPPNILIALILLDNKCERVFFCVVIILEDEGVVAAGILFVVVEVEGQIPEEGRGEGAVRKGQRGGGGDDD